jgi:hypothetical protein
MTEKELRQSVPNWIAKFKGIKEGSTEHKKILSIFNDSKLCTRYTMTTKDSWCATTVSAAFIALSLAGNSSSNALFRCVECSCGSMIDLAKAQGIWVENDAYVPEIGDIIMYYWKDTGTGDCTGWPDHVGVVSSAVSNKSFKVIEGNKNDSVEYRDMTVNAKYIRGYITPKYAEYAKSGKTSTTKVTTEQTTSSSKTTTSSSTTTTTSNTTGSINKTCKFKGTVNATSLKVRAWAGTENPQLRSLTKGTLVEVCDTIKDADGNPWYYIKEGGKYGFVSAEYVTKSASSSSSTTTSTTFSKGDAVKVKSGAKWASGATISSFVFKQTMYVIGSNSKGIIISTTKNGSATGVISKDNLTKA